MFHKKCSNSIDAFPPRRHVTWMLTLPLGYFGFYLFERASGVTHVSKEHLKKSHIYKNTILIFNLK